LAQEVSWHFLSVGDRDAGQAPCRIPGRRAVRTRWRATEPRPHGFSPPGQDLSGRGGSVASAERPRGPTSSGSAARRGLGDERAGGRRGVTGPGHTARGSAETGAGGRRRPTRIGAADHGRNHEFSIRTGSCPAAPRCPAARARSYSGPGSAPSGHVINRNRIFTPCNRPTRFTRATVRVPTLRDRFSVRRRGLRRKRSGRLDPERRADRVSRPSFALIR
jgi:hypothetical protein